MASAVSDSDSIAPSDFPLSSSDDDLLEKNSIVADRCPLCRSPKKHFFCADCIKNGDFHLSNSVERDISNRFIERKLAYLKVKGEIQEILKVSEIYLLKKNRHDTLCQDIRNIQERIKTFKKWKEETQQSLSKCKPLLNSLKAQKNSQLTMLSHLNYETEKAKGNSLENSQKIEAVARHLQAKETQLRGVIRENVSQLFKFIFPITCEGLNSDEDSESLATVKDALADASQTAYVRGQWIYADTGYNGQYRIAGVCLPGTGDMASYQLCVNQAKKADNAETLGHFKVALAHVTQLSHILSFYLGLRLPKKVAHLDFVRNDLDPKRFAGRISRLHANILFLCTSQGVDPVHLRHANPLARLLTLMESNICALGRFGPIEFHPELWSYEEAGEEEGFTSGSSSDEEDSDPLNADWESVLHPPSPDSPSSRTSPAHSKTSTETIPSSNVMGGVVSSVASLWKAWPWSK